MRSPCRRSATLLGLLLAAPAAAAEKGTWWELTTEMEMAGMPFAMPPTTLKLCQPDGDWRRPPEAQRDEHCTVKDVRTSGATMTWRVVCTGEEPMEGDGQVTRTADTLTGRTRLKSRQGEMNLKMRGRRVGPACDPEQQRREAEATAERYRAQGQAAQAQAGAAQARQCEDAVRDMQGMLVLGKDPLCKDPARRAAFCKRARTEEGFSRLMAQAELEKASGGSVPGPKAAARECPLDLAATQADLCAAAAKGDRLEFLSAYCPAEVKAIAKRECAGRDYTAMRGSKYRDLCARAAGEALDAKAGPPPKEKKKPAEDEAVEQGKKLLKGVLGF